MLKNHYDVCVIGAGVIGCAIARELSRYQLEVLVLEKQSDVAEGTTKANSAIVHAGFDADPGSLKARYNVRGSKVFAKYCRELSVPYRQNGSLVLSFNQEGMAELENLRQKGIINHVEGLSIINQDQLRHREPAVGREAYGALLAETGAICSPYDLTIRLAEHASVNGVEFARDCKVTTISRQDSKFLLGTSQGEAVCSFLINAAGVYADQINDMISRDSFSVTPRRGEYWMFDKACGPVFDSTVFQLPTAMGKGVLVTPTVEGTIIVGPSAEDIDDKDDLATTADRLAEILKIAGRSWSKIPVRDSITQFAGLRAHCDRNDFIIGRSADVDGYYLAAGIESPGLTAAPAIAEDIASYVVLDSGASKKSAFAEPPPPIKSFREMNNRQRAEMIRLDPRYGHIICRCEQVSEAEIINAVKRPVGAVTVDGVKRRTRAGMGRCQGGFCLPYVIDILAKELNLSALQVTKMGTGSEILTDRLGGGIDEQD